MAIATVAKPNAATAQPDALFAGDQLNFDERPLVAIWEVTQACDLSCFHCRACAQPLRDLRELTTAEGKRLIDDIAELKVPIFVLTGGDPLKRHDIYELVEHAAQKGRVEREEALLFRRPAVGHLPGLDVRPAGFPRRSAHPRQSPSAITWHRSARSSRARMPASIGCGRPII